MNGSNRTYLLPPLLRWAGSKRQHLSTLRGLVPNFNGRYIEPFAGSACLYWDLAPSKARISDLNEDLINCYKQVRDTPHAIYATYSLLENNSDTYYSVREKYHSETDQDIRSAYFLYLNRYCFNGLYRISKKGKFNVPYGGSRTGSLPSLERLLQYSAKLQDVELLSLDFADCLSDVTEGDFVYLDPPFYAADVRVFREYNATPFEVKDLERFEKALMTVDAAGAVFVASYLDTPEISEIASRWRGEKLSILRRMSGFQAGRKRTDEIVFTNLALSN